MESSRPRTKFGSKDNFDDVDDLDRNLGSIKLKILAFQGKMDQKAYLEWEEKVELIFDIHNYYEEKKVKLVVVEFNNYVMVWWERLLVDKRRNGERELLVHGRR